MNKSVKGCLLLGISMVAIAATAAPAFADEETIKQITAALSSAISQRVGDQVALNLGTDDSHGGAAWGQLGAVGIAHTTGYDVLAGIDTHPGNNYWGGAVNYSTDSRGDFNAYGLSAYFADVFQQDSSGASFLLVEANYTSSDPNMGSSNNAFSGTADMNWVWRGSSTLTRFDVSYTGISVSGGGVGSNFLSDVGAGLEVGFPSGMHIPYLVGRVSESFGGSSASELSSQLGVGIRGEVSATTTLGAEAGAEIPQHGDAGWYALLKFRSRFN